MTIERTQPLLSYADYSAIDDDRRYEVIEGELVEMPSPSLRHQALVGELFTQLHLYAKASKAGRAFVAPFDVVLRADRPANVFQPDVVFVSTARRGILTPANVQGAPDLAVEVLSPSNARNDTIRKLGLYAKHAVAEIWFVSHEFDEVKVMRLEPTSGQYGKPEVLVAGDVLTSLLLPGFSLPIEALFAAIDPELI